MSEKNHDHENVKDNAPYNPLSPHAEDPDFESQPTHEPAVGHGGEYDQKPYIDQTVDSHDTDGHGEYDQKNYRDHAEGRPKHLDS